MLRQVIELESAKLGAVMLVLGVIHFLNILVLAKMRKTPVQDRVAVAS